MSKETTIISIIAVVFIIIIGVLIWKSSAFVAPATVSSDYQQYLVRSDSHMTGSSTAKVTMVEFGDYECPACGAAYPVIKQVTDSYANNPNFNFVFRNFPLPQHSYAKLSAEAAEAAGAQGKYWQMHGALYAGQNDWDPIVNTSLNENSSPFPIFVGYAKNLGLDVTKFQSDLQNNAYADTINADLADVAKLGLDHTPTVFINGVEETDLSVTGLEAKINSLLGK